MNFDCFGLQNINGKYSCKGLTKLDCDDCNFFKTDEQVKQEQQKTERRLKKISHFNNDSKLVVNILK